MTPTILLIALLGHPRHTVREQATRWLVQQGQPALAVASIAMRSRDPEVRRRGELVRRVVIDRLVESCRPKDYRLWPCIDMITGWYPALRWSGHWTTDPSWPVAEAIMIAAYTDRCSRPPAVGAIQPDWWWNWRCGTALWVRHLIEAGHPVDPIRRVVAEMARREREYVKLHAPRRDVIIWSDGVSIISIRSAILP